MRHNDKKIFKINNLIRLIMSLTQKVILFKIQYNASTENI